MKNAIGGADRESIALEFLWALRDCEGAMQSGNAIAYGSLDRRSDKRSK